MSHHKRIHIDEWLSPDRKTRNQTGHVTCASSVLDTHMPLCSPENPENAQSPKMKLEYHVAAEKQDATYRATCGGAKRELCALKIGS